MDRAKTQARLTGCYVPIPTLFYDGDLELNLPAMRRHVQFLLRGGLRTGNGVLLVCGGAGDFPTLSTDERFRALDAVLEAADGKIGVVLGAQSTSPREVLALARGAKARGALALQVAPPFYHQYTADDIYEFMVWLSDASEIGLVFYTTYWQGPIGLDLLDRIVDLPQVVAIKWAAPGSFEFEQGVRRFAPRTHVIDNQLQYVISHMLGARGVNVHPPNYDPAWGVKFWELLEARRYFEAEQEQVRIVSPYYDLGVEIGKFTGGEGHLDKLCLELVGLDSSRCRPPTRDIRPQFREPVRAMLQQAGVPGVRPR